MLLNELLIKIGIKTDEKDLDKLKETNSLLGKLPITAGIIGTAFAGAVAGLTHLQMYNLQLLMIFISYLK